jgi:hypothetical protein
MKTFITLFLSSATFGAVAAIVYWFSSREIIGTLLLGLMALGLSFAAGYALLAERNANLPGDDETMQHKETAGEDLGIFTKESAWPILLAFSILALFVGVVWSPFVAAAGLVAMLLILWRLSAESARV